MVYVITDPCIATCDTGCVSVCPVDCIQGPVALPVIENVPKAERATEFPGLQLYINPDECIFCGACVSECPVNAIYEEDDVPAQWHASIERNAAFFRR
jgi:NAD-dependent dihydropyrimidine dehydrogenase PreA subunit